MLEQTRVDGGGQAASARLNEEINQWAPSSHISPPGPGHCALYKSLVIYWRLGAHDGRCCTLNITHRYTTDIFQDFSRCKDFKIGLFRSRFIKIFQDFSRFFKIYSVLETTCFIAVDSSEMIIHHRRK